MKILIWGEQLNGGPYDVFRDLDYNCIYYELLQNYNANALNVGNKVWIQGILSSLLQDDNQIYFLNSEETWDQINEKYDKIVYSAANMLCNNLKSLISKVAKIFKNSKIPVYVIAVGAQAQSYSHIDELVKSIKNETKEFLDSIYSSGGEIACRGFFTKEVLDRIDNNTSVVTGCPSLFQNGRELYIKKSKDAFLPVFNGALLKNKRIMEKYPKSVFIDQDNWLQEFYNVDFYNKSKCEILKNLVDKHGHFDTGLFLHKRIRLFYDVFEWKRYLINSGFNFSCGTKIHGNIIAILSGIPSLVMTVDSRTREIADFYKIPYLQYSENIENIEELYNTIDYSDFNKNFKIKFNSFENFLINCGLISGISTTSQFENRRLPIQSSKITKRIKSVARLNDIISIFGENGWKIFFKINKRKYNDNQLFETVYTCEEYRDILLGKD